MQQPGRQSIDNLTVIAPENIRPEPPDFLTSEQKTEWKAIVGRLPADWFTREQHGILIQYLEHWQTATILAEKIRDMGNPEDEDMPHYETLLNMHRKTSTTMLALARSMRITNQSRYHAKVAASRSDKGGESKPWAKAG